MVSEIDFCLDYQFFSCSVLLTSLSVSCKISLSNIFVILNTSGESSFHHVIEYKGHGKYLSSINTIDILPPNAHCHCRP